MATFDPATYKGFGSQLMPYLTALAGSDAGVQNAFGAGLPLAGEFYNFGSLGRVDSTLANKATTGQVNKSLDYLQKDAANARTRTPEAQARLDMLQGLATRAQGYSPEEQQVMALRQANLGGMTQEEEQMLRNQGQTSLTRNLNNALRGLRSRFPGATGAAGSLAAQPVVNQFADQSRQFANDLNLQKLGAKRDALNAYDSTVGNMQNNLYNRSLAATQAYNTAGSGQQQFEAANRLQANNALLGAQQAVRNDALARQQYNLQQMANEKAGQLGLIFGSGQFGAAQQGRQDALKVAREAISKNAAAGGGGNPMAIFQSIANSFGQQGSGTTL